MSLACFNACKDACQVLALDALNFPSANACWVDCLKPERFVFPPSADEACGAVVPWETVD